MTAEEERQLTEAIRRSEVGTSLLFVGVDAAADEAWARFRLTSGDPFTVSSAWTSDSTVESVAADLIFQARAKLSDPAA